MHYKSKRAKACDIPTLVKAAVLERDGGLCILCGKVGMPNAHYIPRSAGGLGIKQNIVTLCLDCHRLYDQSEHRQVLGARIRAYLAKMYAHWDESGLVYRKEQYGGVSDD